MWQNAAECGGILHVVKNVAMQKSLNIPVCHADSKQLSTKLKSCHAMTPSTCVRCRMWQMQQKMQWKMWQCSRKCSRKYSKRFLHHHIFYHMQNSTAFYHILPHLTTSYHILPHSATFCHIPPHLSESHHKRTWLATFTTRFLLRVQQASSEKATAAFEFRMWMHIVRHFVFRLSRSDPEIMTRLFSVPQGRHCGDMWQTAAQCGVSLVRHLHEQIA
jgi:hypothetical protein